MLNFLEYLMYKIEEQLEGLPEKSLAFRAKKEELSWLQKLKL